MKRVQIRYLLDPDNAPKRMSLIIASKRSLGKNASMVTLDKVKNKLGARYCLKKDIKWGVVSMARRKIRDACRMLDETGKKVWYCTLTYRVAESRGRVVMSDLERVRNWAELQGGRFVGVMELSEAGDLHAHCLIAGIDDRYSDSDSDTFNSEVSSVWSKGFVHSRLRYYNAEKAGGYLCKQYGNGERYEVDFRKGKRVVYGMEGYRELWKRMPFLVLDNATKTRVGSYEYVREGMRGAADQEIVQVITKDKAKAGEGELFAVVKADLLCVDKDRLGAMTVKEFRARLNSIHITRGVNGTLYATNNARVPSALMKWMIEHKKEVLIDTFKRARAQILLEGSICANDAN